MKRVLFAGIGAAGDVMPLWAIRDELRSQQIEVSTVDLSSRCRNPSLRLVLSKPGDVDMPVKFLDQVVMAYLNVDCQTIFQEAVAFRPDIIVCNSFCFAARLVAHALGIPVISCAIMPAFWHRNITPDSVIALLWAQTINAAYEQLPGTANIDAVPLINDCTLELRLFPDEFPSSEQWETKGNRSVAIGACWGFGGTTAPKLREWLTEQQRVCLVSFGSWVSPEYKRPVAELIVTTLLEDPSWSILYVGDGAPAPRNRLYSAGFTDFVPMDIACSAMSASITHAGIGSLMQVLRWGDPTVCVPFCADQPTNAKFMGDNYAVPRLDPALPITADDVRQAFEKRAGYPRYRQISSHTERAAQHILSCIS